MFVRLNHHNPSTTQTTRNTISSTATLSLLPTPRATTVPAYRVDFDALETH